MSRVDRQRGSATVFGVVVIGLIVLLGLTLVTVLGAVAVRIETETAADAAALAAVAAAVDGRAPRAHAASAAAANGAKLVRCRCPGFSGGTFSATVLVAREVRIPILGQLRVDAERSAEYAIDP